MAPMWRWCRGGFTTTRVRDACGFDEDLANQFIFDDQGGLAGWPIPFWSGNQTGHLGHRPASGADRVPGGGGGDGANDLDSDPGRWPPSPSRWPPKPACASTMATTALLFAQGRLSTRREPIRGRAFVIT